VTVPDATMIGALGAIAGFAGWQAKTATANAQRISEAFFTHLQTAAEKLAVMEEEKRAHMESCQISFREQREHSKEAREHNEKIAESLNQVVIALRSMNGFKKETTGR
jgi:hypothetical protein